MLETIVVGVIVLLGVLLGTLYMTRKMDEIVENLTENAINDAKDWFNSDEGQKTFYSIGVLIGNGAKSGFGIAGRGGKMKLQDVITQGIAQFVMQKMGSPIQLGIAGTAQEKDKSLNI